MHAASGEASWDTRAWKAYDGMTNRSRQGIEEGGRTGTTTPAGAGGRSMTPGRGADSHADLGGGHDKPAAVNI